MPFEADNTSRTLFDTIEGTDRTSPVLIVKGDRAFLEKLLKVTEEWFCTCSLSAFRAQVSATLRHAKAEGEDASERLRALAHTLRDVERVVAVEVTPVILTEDCASSEGWQVRVAALDVDLLTTGRSGSHIYGQGPFGELTQHLLLHLRHVCPSQMSLTSEFRSEFHGRFPDDVRVSPPNAPTVMTLSQPSAQAYVEEAERALAALPDRVERSGFSLQEHHRQRADFEVLLPVSINEARESFTEPLKEYLRSVVPEALRNEERRRLKDLPDAMIRAVSAIHRSSTHADPEMFYSSVPDGMSWRDWARKHSCFSKATATAIQFLPCGSGTLLRIDLSTEDALNTIEDRRLVRQRVNELCEQIAERQGMRTPLDTSSREDIDRRLCPDIDWRARYESESVAVWLPQPQDTVYLESAAQEQGLLSTVMAMRAREAVWDSAATSAAFDEIRAQHGDDMFNGLDLRPGYAELIGEKAGEILAGRRLQIDPKVFENIERFFDDGAPQQTQNIRAFRSKRNHGIG